MNTSNIKKWGRIMANEEKRKKELELEESKKIVEVSDFIISITKTEPIEGCETKIKLFKNSFKPDKDV